MAGNPSLCAIYAHFQLFGEFLGVGRFRRSDFPISNFASPMALSIFNSCELRMALCTTRLVLQVEDGKIYSEWRANRLFGMEDAISNAHTSIILL